MTSKAIVLRTRIVGVGSNYDNAAVALTQLGAYFDNLLKQNPNDLTAPTMAALVTSAMQALQAMRAEDAAAITNQQQQINSLATTTQTAQTQAQAMQAASISTGEALGVAIASALGGGAIGWFIRAKLKE